MRARRKAGQKREATFDAFSISSRVVITLVAHQVANIPPEGEREGWREEGVDE